MPIGIRQRDATDCGAACLATICASYGLFVPVARVRQWAGTDSTGTSLLGLTEAADKLGMNAKALRVEYERLQKIPLPAIAHVELENGFHHYVVLCKVFAEKLEIMDPSEGSNKIISFEEFKKLWKGVIVTITPGADFRENKPSPVRKRIFEVVLGHRKALLLATGSAVVFSILGIGISLYLKEIVDEVLEDRNSSLLTALSVLMLGILAVQFLTGQVKGFLTLKTSQDVESGLILGYFRHLLHLPQSFFDSMRVGEMVSRVNDAVKINVFINEAAIAMIVDLLTLFFSISLMFIFQWKLALLAMIVIPVYGLIFFRSDRINSKWQRKIMESGADLESGMISTLTGASTLKMLGMEQYMSEILEKKLVVLLNRIRRSASAQLIIHGFADFFTKSFAVLILWLGCYFVFSAELTRGELLSFFALTSYFTMPVLFLFGISKQYRDATIAAERLFEIMDLERETQKNISNNKLSFSSAENFLMGDIVFDNVSFRYGNGKYVIKNFNCKIPKGEITGIRGASGCGKSTLGALLLKLYQPVSGKIMLNNIQLSEIDHVILRKNIAVVPQKIDLFPGTIRDNITIGHNGSNDLLDEIVIWLGIATVAARLPLGLDTNLNAQASNLSGGEKQKIAIARALYRNAPILLMDEPTAAMDKYSEEKIMQTIDWYQQKGNTVIIISHNESTLKNCDNIVFLREGHRGKDD